MAELDPQEQEDLRKLSAQLGADPLLVQGAGGNTSLKQGNILWIKGSGTWLMNAGREDIFVSVRSGELLKVFNSGDPDAECGDKFVIEGSGHGLRPSIETTMHAIMPQRVVLHVHCVGTIAVAIREDAEQILTEKLEGLNWALIPYVRPGLPLSHAMQDAANNGKDVLILSNHGLVVGADSVSEAEKLLRQVSGLLTRKPRTAAPPDLDALTQLARETDYQLSSDERIHDLACDPQSLRVATGGSLYPDHVVFLGRGSQTVRSKAELIDLLENRQQTGMSAPVSILVPGKGVLMRGDANPGAHAMARCLADVTARVPEGAPVYYLNDAENDELLNWDAERYRQTLNRQDDDTQP